MPADNGFDGGRRATELGGRVGPTARSLVQMHARPRAWVLALALAAAVTGLLLLAVGAPGAPTGPCDPDLDPGCSRDTTPPQTTITAGPSGPTSDNTPQFSFTSSDGALASTFECQIDGGDPVSCDSPHTTATLTDGSHTFSVAATDEAGNTDPTPATRTFSVDAVDTTAPTVSLTKPTANEFWVNKYKRATLPLEASASDERAVQRVEFYVRGEKVGEDTTAPYQLPFDTATKPDGDAEIHARAVDTSGNAGESSRTTVILDNTAPDVNVTSAPAGPVQPSSVRFDVRAHDENWLYGNMTCWKDTPEPGAFGNYEYCIAAGVDKTFTGTYQPSGLSDGVHQIYFRAHDAAGNAGTALQSVMVDGTAPSTEITSGPTGQTADTTPEFGFSSSEAGSTFRCRIDDAPAVSCGSPYTTPPLADGPHTLSVAATDVAGNADPTPATRSFTVVSPPPDTTAPDTAITSGPSGTATSSSASFGLSSSEAGSTLECSLDGAGFSACSSPKAYTGLASGTHVFKVRARDAAGNVDASPAERSWKVDATRPTVTAVSPTAGKTGVAPTANVLVTFSEPMRASTLTKTTVKLVRKGTTKSLAATLTYDAARRRATLNPKSALARRAIYTATVSTGVKDAAGNPLARAKSWSFTVRR